MSCDIIIPVWNQPEITKECIDSLVKYTDYPYRLIIIDNGSGWATKDYLEGLKNRSAANVMLIRNGENLGFVKAVNQGMRASDAPYICLMNNDTIATQGWLTDIIEAMESNPGVGLANPSSNTSGQFPKRDESIYEYAASRKNLKGRLQELYVCRGFCMIIKRQVMDRLGLFDEVYNMGYFEETEYSVRAQLAGFKIARIKSSYVYHRESATFKRLQGYEDLFKKNENIFLKRWGKRLRIAYMVRDRGNYEKIDHEVTDLARKGNEILVFLKKGLKWPVSIDHFGIRRIDVNPYFFGIVSAYKILRYRKKKRVDIIRSA